VPDHTKLGRAAAQDCRLEEDTESLGEEMDGLAACRIENAALVALVRKAAVEVDSLAAEAGRANL